MSESNATRTLAPSGSGVSPLSKVPDAEKSIIGYLLNFPEDEDSFQKLSREHFSHPMTARVFNAFSEIRESNEVPDFSSVGAHIRDADPSFKIGKVSEWLSLGDSNSFPLYFPDLEQSAKDRANGGIRFYFQDAQNTSTESGFIQDCPYHREYINF